MKKITIILISMLLLTACGHSEINMSVDKDGNVSIKNTISIEDNVINFDSVLLSEKTSNGYIVNKNNNTYVFQKQLGSINKLGYGNGKEVVINNLMNNFNEGNLFECKSYIYKKVCIANFVVDLSNINSYEEMFLILNKKEDKINIDKTLAKEYYSLLNEDMDSTFVLTSDLKVEKNNAFSTINNKYIWKLKYGEKNNIKFILSFPNRNFYAFSIIFGLTLFIILVILIKNKIASKKFKKININKSLSKEDESLINEKTNDQMDNKKTNIQNINERIRNRY